MQTKPRHITLIWISFVPAVLQCAACQTTYKLNYASERHYPITILMSNHYRLRPMPIGKGQCLQNETCNRPDIYNMLNDDLFNVWVIVNIEFVFSFKSWLYIKILSNNIETLKCGKLLFSICLYFSVCLSESNRCFLISDWISCAQIFWQTPLMISTANSIPILLLLLPLLLLLLLKLLHSIASCLSDMKHVTEQRLAFQHLFTWKKIFGLQFKVCWHFTLSEGCCGITFQLNTTMKENKGVRI